MDSTFTILENMVKDPAQQQKLKMLKVSLRLNFQVACYSQKRKQGTSFVVISWKMSLFPASKPPNGSMGRHADLVEAETIT